MPLGFLLIVIAFLFIYLALVRPQRRRQLEQAQMWQSLEVGDEIVTAGGMYGTITGFHGDDLLVRFAPQLEVRVARRAVAALIEPEPELEDEQEALEEAEPEADDEGHDPAAAAPIDDRESYPEGSR